tara:strand:- start:5428 stop:7149 length:1722 start_codon:yes stop_codon:yes gene_type:complete
MCGFFCLWQPSGICKTEVMNALSATSHRGPDFSNLIFEENGNLVLGHQRLSILDLSSNGNQPMKSRDNKVITIYNGEIYNFKELSREYKINLESRCDTELLTEFFCKEDISCLDKLNGMFSGVFYSKENKKITIFRDRFGIKPLFYTFLKNGGIAISSEIKALMQLQDVNKSPNLNVIRTFLDLSLYDHSEETFFEGIFSLEQGSYATFNLNTNQFKKNRWYSLPERINNQSNNFSELEAIEYGKYLIQECITSHLISDVSLGINISGGVDSSLLSATASKNIKDLNLLTMDFGGGYSEFEWVSLNKKYGNIKRIPIDLDSLESKFNRVIRMQDQPFGGITVIGYDNLYEVAKNNSIKVLLDGNGIDEVFLGYSKYKIDNTKNNLSIDGTVSNQPKLVSEDLRRNSKIIDIPSIDLNIPNFRVDSLQDLLFRKIPRNLRFNDLASMSHSCELRVPFLDYRLVEFGFSLPYSFLKDKIHSKKIIRRICADLVGPKVAYAKKRSVQSPQREILAKEWKEKVRNIIEDNRTKKRGWIDVNYARNFYENYVNNKFENSFPIWQILNLELWAREWFDK